MKKICFSCPTLLLRRPIADIIARMRSFKITLLTPEHLVSGFINIHFNKVKNAKICSYSILDLPFSSSDWPIPINPYTFIKIFKIIKDNDIIHMWVPFYIINTYIALLKKIFFKNKKLFLTMDTFPGYSFKMGKLNNKFFSIYYKYFGKLIFSATDRVIIYGKSFEKYTKILKIPSEKVEIISTGINLNQREKNIDIRKEFNIEDDEKIVLFIGVLTYRKGIDLIIETARILKQEKIRFIIVGDSPKRKYYENLKKKYKLKDKVIFTGYRKDVYNFYHTADVFFLPSRGEGLPGVLMESMVYGVPIVSSNIPGTRDLIQNNENGFLCRFDDIECYSKKIMIILNDKNIQTKFIKKSKDIINKKFNWHINIKKFIKLYE